MTSEDRVLAPFHRSLGARLRSWFFAGLVLFGPLAVTLYVAWWFVNTVDNWVRPLVPASFWPETYLPFSVPGFGVAIVLVGLTLLGFIAANVAGRTLVRIGEAMLDRLPVLRGLYKGVKQIFETLFSQSGTHFRRVGLVEYPIKGAWSIVFLSSEPPPQIAAVLPAELVHVCFPALHAEPDHRLLLLPADQGHRRIGDHAGRGGQARDVGRAPAAGRRRDARRACAGRRARALADARRNGGLKGGLSALAPLEIA